MSTSETLLVKHLSISFGNNKTQNEDVHDISFEINENEILVVVGESG
jgi:peptide/nickel transport system ATP-binding protein